MFGWRGYGGVISWFRGVSVVGSGGVGGVGGWIVPVVTGWWFLVHGNPDVFWGTWGRFSRSVCACGGSPGEGAGGGVSCSVSHVLALLTSTVIPQPTLPLRPPPHVWYTVGTAEKRINKADAAVKPDKPLPMVVSVMGTWFDSTFCHARRN